MDPQIESAKPTVDGFQLPCGWIDAAGVLHTDIEVEGMNGRDEETLAARNMPIIRKLNRILARCTVAIGPIRDKKMIENIIPDLTQGDRMYLLFAIRRVSLGDEFPFSAECPHCKKENHLHVNLADLEVKHMADPYLRTYELTLSRSKKRVSMKVMTGRGEEALSKAADSGSDPISTAMLARIDAIDGRPARIGDLLDLSLADRNQLRDAWPEREGGIDTEVEVTCSFCEADFKTDVDMASQGFFNPLAVLKAWKTK